MRKKKIIHTILIYLIATVWLANGLVCKVLNLVPRHAQIISRILGSEYSVFFTKAIGVSETLMALWILSGFKTRLNAVTQIILVATMNILEFILVPDLLLFGKFNSIFALIFIIIIYYNEFVLNKKLAL
jgi:uncharacterized membrane protein YphA (DoxX/SURF4 family)